LLKKWEEKKTHCNMVITELHRNQNKDEEDDVWVITRDRAKMGMDLENGEISSQGTEGKIRKAAQAHPKFGIAQ
jgi:hypothetical protein